MRCVAVPVQGTLGISMSGPTPRMTAELVERAIPLLHEAGERLASEIGTRSA